MDGHYFLLCTAPSPGTLQERGISPVPSAANHGWAWRGCCLVIRKSSALLAVFGRFKRQSNRGPRPQTGVCHDVTGNEEVNNFDRVRFKGTLFCL